MSYSDDFNAVFGDQTLLGEFPKPLDYHTIVDVELNSTWYRLTENHRFQGAREAFKFNWAMEQMVSFYYWFDSLSTSTQSTNTTINSRLMIPDSVLTTIAHARKQIEFLGYKRLKSRVGRWF